MKLQTLAVHAGDRKKPGKFVPVTTPIYAASSFFYDETEELDRVFGGEQAGESYARFGNPSVAAVEEQIAVLEGAEVSIGTSSGMAAVQLALLTALTDRRRSIVAADVLYGATTQVLMDVLEPTGVKVRFCDVCDLDRLEAVVAEEKPAAVYVETLSNPLMRVPALDRVSEIAHRNGALVIADATFTTPVLMRPFELGADFVVHSATKYLAGHGDAMGGFLLTSEKHREVAHTLHHTLGYNLGPFAAYFTMRGMKTLPLRVRRQCENAAKVVAWLEKQPEIETVHYPGLEAHPDREVARRLLADGRFGAMVSFELTGGKPAAYALVDKLKMIVRGSSLGDVHSMMLHPATSSHRNLAPKHRQRLGIGDGLLRLSLGIESAEDIIADLGRALA